MQMAPEGCCMVASSETNSKVRSKLVIFVRIMEEISQPMEVGRLPDQMVIQGHLIKSFGERHS